MSEESDIKHAHEAWLKGRKARNEADRIQAAQTLTSLLPSSLPTVERALSPSRNSLLEREFQFTLFCYLDDALDREEAKYLLPMLIALIGRYLTKVPDNRARATWMAADLLTDHLPAEDVVDTYIVLLRSAHHAVTRGLLVRAAEKLLPRLSRPAQARVIDTITVLAGDRSLRVREEVGNIVANFARRAEDVPNAN